MRRYLTKALETEVEEGELTEAQAIAFAQRIMYENQMQCFDVEATRTANVEALTAAV
jgi:polyhydroxyalkanoate synthesis regulator phasin